MPVDLTHYVVPTGFIYLWFLLFTLYILPVSSPQFSFTVSLSPPFPPPLSLSLSLSLSHTHTHTHTQKVITCKDAFDWFLSIQHCKCFDVVRLRRRKSWWKECVIWRWSSSVCSRIAKLYVLFYSKVWRAALSWSSCASLPCGDQKLIGLGILFSIKMLNYFL